MATGAFEPLQPHVEPTPPPALRAPPPSPPMAPVVIDHTPRLQAGLEALKQEASRLGEQARSDALEIGVLIARRILERELSSSLDPLFGLIRSAIRRVGEARQIVVKVSPDDHRRLQETPGASLSLANVTVQPDESLQPGDVVVESELHGVDARLDTRLDELRRELREAMKGD
jgi:flagellar assembly protein FliH